MLCWLSITAKTITQYVKLAERSELNHHGNHDSCASSLAVDFTHNRTSISKQVQSKASTRKKSILRNIANVTIKYLL